MTAHPAAEVAGYRPTRRLRLVASEPSAAYDRDPVVVFEAGFEGLFAGSLDELDEPTIEAMVGVAERAKRRLDAWTARATATLADRQARRAAEANPRDKRAQERARREVRNELARRNGWSPTEAKDKQRLGRALARSPELAEAAGEGAISSANAVKLGRFLELLMPDDRAKVDRQLREAAETQDPVTFARTLETVRGELNPDDAAKAEQRRHSRRRASVSQTEDGMTRIYAELATVDGALATRAIDTFRRMDTPGEHRRPEQRTADAIVDLTRAALRDDGDDHDTAGGPSVDRPSRNHGTRPHVVVTIPIDVLLAGTGMVDLDGTDVPLDAVRHLMDDAGWAFVVTKTNTTPIVATGESRTVSAALWRALVLRDGGCIHETCDAKPDWCDTMHLTDPYRNGGRLTLDNAALGCRTHHRAYDDGRLELHWDDDRPVLRRRSRDDGNGNDPPPAGPAP